MEELPRHSLTITNIILKASGPTARSMTSLVLNLHEQLTLPGVSSVSPHRLPIFTTQPQCFYTLKSFNMFLVFQQELHSFLPQKLSEGNFDITSTYQTVVFQRQASSLKKPKYWIGKGVWGIPCCSPLLLKILIAGSLKAASAQMWGINNLF